MALWTCTGCTTAYAVGAPRCPHCGNTDHVEEGQPMPKISVYGGPSIAGATLVGGTWTDGDEPDAWPAADDGGSEQPSAGTSSSTSDEKPPSSPSSGETTTSRARTTGSRSRRDRTAASTAPSTAGAPTEPSSASSDTD